MAEQLRQIPREYTQSAVLNQQKNVRQSGEPGLVRRGSGKLMDGATWVSKKTFLPFTAVWGASVVFPGVIPAAIGTGAGVGALTDGGTLLLDKTRKKDRGSLPRQGNIFSRSARSVGGGLVAIPRQAVGQITGR